MTSKSFRSNPDVYGREPPLLAGRNGPTSIPLRAAQVRILAGAISYVGLPDTFATMFSSTKEIVVTTKIEKTEGWVFTKEGTTEGTTEEIGFAESGECRNGEDACRQFSRECAEHFDVYFRTDDGVLHAVAATSEPADFYPEE
jgi:hypothetical protein